ncbi:hypothetical protein TI04_02930 [Achromatium sp. WMS2]|nr:hypothetical protein TI04_02930 [Achromatium sp. WMS2]
MEQFEQQSSIRYKQFRELHVTRLIDYNKQASTPIPRCVLIVDEAQKLFEGRDYQQKADVTRILSSIARQGAAAGIHIILSTQSFQNVALESDAKEQFHLRIGLRHATSMGCRALMGRDNDAMLELEPYTAIYNSHQGETQRNKVVALADLPNFHTRLNTLKAKYPQTTQQKTPSTQQRSTQATKNNFASGDVSAEW